MIKIRLSSILGDYRMTQSELAKKTGIRPATINDMYNEVTKYVSIENLSKICEALDCTTEDILEYIPDNEYHKFRQRK